MNRLALLFALAVFSCDVGAHAQELESRYVREVKTPESAEQQLVAVPIDSLVYASSEPQLADVRIQDETSSDTPYLHQRVQAKREQVKRVSWRAVKPTAKPNADGLEVTLQLEDDDPQVDGIRIVTPLKDFEQRVRVFSSRDGKAWRPCGDESVIFDYSRYMDVRRDVIRFPQTNHRYFRLVVDALTSEQESELLQLTRRLRGGVETSREERLTVARRPFRIDKIQMSVESVEEVAIGDEKSAYDVSSFRVVEDLANQQTHVHVETPQTPLTSLRLLTSTKNFSRRVSVSVQVAESPEPVWRPLAASVLSRIDFKHLQREQLEISFPETRAAVYRMTIDNRDSPPLAIDGVESEGNVYRLLFFAQPNSVYQLTYGGGETSAPLYDTAAIHAVVNEGFSPALADLGPQRDFAVLANQGEQFSWLRDPRFIFAVILVLVIVLGVALYSANQRLKQLPANGKQ